MAEQGAGEWEGAMNDIGPPSLNDLGFSRRWVTWIDENDSKVPKDPATGRNASSNDRGTWGERGMAERRWRQMQNGKDKGGIGFVLGRGVSVMMPPLSAGPGTS
jgi:hypothetical protein